MGERFRELRSAVETSRQVDFEAKERALEGPRTTAWWLQEVSRTGLGPVARHNAWRHENKLNEDDHKCVTHELLSEVLELLVCIDQLDGANLVGAESAARHVQFIEYEVKKKVESKKGYDQSEYFLGRHRRTGGALVHPELLKWVSEKAQKDSLILKEQRKAAEERALQSKK